MSVTQFPKFKLSDVPASLRTLAHQIETGERPVRRAVVAIETPDGGIDYCALGEDFTVAHAVGLLHICASRIAEAME